MQSAQSTVAPVCHSQRPAPSAMAWFPKYERLSGKRQIRLSATSIGRKIPVEVTSRISRDRTCARLRALTNAFKLRITKSCPAANSRPAIAQRLRTSWASGTPGESGSATKARKEKTKGWHSPQPRTRKCEPRYAREISAKKKIIRNEGVSLSLKGSGGLPEAKPGSAMGFDCSIFVQYYQRVADVLRN